MSSFRAHRTSTYGEEGFPLRGARIDVEVTLDEAVPVPDAALRRLAYEALRATIEDMDADSFDLGARAGGHASWNKPDGLDMRIIKSAHRVVTEIARRGTGKMVLASELVKGGHVSAPTMSRLLRFDEPSGAYLAPYVRITPAGRTKGLDLTPEGRRLASLIRAGDVPS